LIVDLGIIFSIFYLCRLWGLPVWGLIKCKVIRRVFQVLSPGFYVAFTLINIDVNIVIIERDEKSIIGSKLCISATSGEKMVAILAGKLLKISALCAKSAGHKSRLQIKQMRRADDIPNFANITRQGNVHESIEGRLT
jgi:hypothetical protein